MITQAIALDSRLDRRRWRDLGARRVGLYLAFAAVGVHTVGGTFANEWQGWGTALQNVSVGLVAGALALALTFGLLVRVGARGEVAANRPARAALILGAITLITIPAVFWTGATAVLGAGAVTLGLEGLRLARDGHGRSRPAAGGLLLGAAAVAFALAFYAANIIAGVLDHWV